MKQLTALFVLLLTAATAAFGNTAAPDAGFPGREKYKHIKTVELKQLRDLYKDVIIVDARSRYEYTTLHIKDAVNVPVHADDFAEKVDKIRKATPKPIVFYCNGRDCLKSYQAAERAKNARIQDVFAFDAGVFEWAKAHPDLTVMLGKSPIDPKELLSKDALAQHMLSPADFDKKAFDDNVIIVDVRDTTNSRSNPLFPLKQRYVPLDNDQLRGVVDEAKRTGKTLLIYDNVGKQVQWLQYFLEREKVPSYYFLKGGADGYLDIEVARLLNSVKERNKSE